MTHPIQLIGYFGDWFSVSVFLPLAVARCRCLVPFSYGKPAVLITSQMQNLFSQLWPRVGKCRLS